MAFLYEEKGYEKVKKLLEGALKPFMHALNVLEVQYKTNRKDKKSALKNKRILSKLPLNVVHLTDDNILNYACHLKSEYELSIADSIGIASSRFLKTTFLTADRRELEPIAKAENLNIEFIR